MGVAGVQEQQLVEGQGIRHREADFFSALPYASEWKRVSYSLHLLPKIFTHSNINSAFSAVTKDTYSLAKGAWLSTTSSATGPCYKALVITKSNIGIPWEEILNTNSY